MKCREAIRTALRPVEPDRLADVVDDDLAGIAVPEMLLEWIADAGVRSPSTYWFSAASSSSHFIVFFQSGQACSMCLTASAGRYYTKQVENTTSLTWQAHKSCRQCPCSFTTAWPSLNTMRLGTDLILYRAAKLRAFVDVHLHNSSLGGSARQLLPGLGLVFCTDHTNSHRNPLIPAHPIEEPLARMSLSRREAPVAQLVWYAGSMFHPRNFYPRSGWLGSGGLHRKHWG